MSQMLGKDVVEIHCVVTIPWHFKYIYMMCVLLMWQCCLQKPMGSTFKKFVVCVESSLFFAEQKKLLFESKSVGCLCLILVYKIFITIKWLWNLLCLGYQFPKICEKFIRSYWEFRNHLFRLILLSSLISLVVIRTLSIIFLFKEFLNSSLVIKPFSFLKIIFLLYLPIKITDSRKII